MLYPLLKIWVRLAALIFCRKIIINNRRLLKEKGPLLLACNHPNSFLDAVLLDILFEQPIWSLARGDAFINKRVKRIFEAVKILPVYRTGEGVENLSGNYKTFDACVQIFKKNGLVQIFSEGKCINEWHLRPLKKGTARLATKTWEEGIPLKVLSVGINYSSFFRFGKNIFINFGTMIEKKDVDWNVSDGIRNLQFNNLLQEQLSRLVYEIDKNNTDKKAALLTVKTSLFKKILLAIPAAIGYIFHCPLYTTVKYFMNKKKSFFTDHFDSVIIAVLTFTYPLYLLLIAILFFVLFKSLWAFLLLLILPFTAWAFVQLKPQLDKQQQQDEDLLFRKLL
jgi:1-acyl-sn-glycerol-3-phosphate acyltransferase